MCNVLSDVNHYSTVEFHLEILSTQERRLLDPLNVGSLIHHVNLIGIEMENMMKIIVPLMSRLTAQNNNKENAFALTRGKLELEILFMKIPRDKREIMC